MIISKNLQNKLKQNGWDGELELDVLNHICVRFSKEFFGDKCINENDFETFSHTIMTMFRLNKPQKEIEKYIWDNCKFNNLTKTL